MTYKTVQNMCSPWGALLQFWTLFNPYCLKYSHTVLWDMLSIFLLLFCSHMMEMSRDVRKSSPNVIAHIEMEAEKHQLDDELRRKKVEQLKVSLFLITFINLFSLKIGFYKDSFSAWIFHQMEQYNCFKEMGWVFSMSQHLKIFHLISHQEAWE